MTKLLSQRSYLIDEAVITEVIFIDEIMIIEVVFCLQSLGHIWFPFGFQTTRL